MELKDYFPKTTENKYKCKECGSDNFDSDLIIEHGKTIVIYSCRFCLQPIYSIDMRDY